MRKYFRNTALLLFGVYATLRGVAYLPIFYKVENLPYGLERLSHAFSIEFWGSVWLIFGIFAIIVSLLDRLKPLAWGLIVGITTAWGTAYLFGFLSKVLEGDYSRDWLTASSYILPAIIIGILSRENEVRLRDITKRE